PIGIEIVEAVRSCVVGGNRRKKPAHPAPGCLLLQCRQSLGALGRGIAEVATPTSRLRCGVVDQDLELLQRCLSGENSAWEGLLRVYTRKIYNLCYRFTGRAEEAEDLTQEVFIKIFQTLRSFDAAQGSFSTWMHRVARNHLVDHYRRTKKDRMTGSIEDDLETLAEKPSPGAGP